jgi:nucleotide-binding universal stress UspA family protein
MLPEIKKILFASDLTETSKHAYSYAASLASRFCAEVVFLYVMHDLPHSAKGFLNPELLEQIRIHERNSAKSSLIGKKKNMAIVQDELQRYCYLTQNQATGSGYSSFEYQVVVTEGNIVDMIIQTSIDYDCDTIVLGSHRASVMSDIVLGSVVRGVLRRSERLVVIAPPIPG